MVTNSSPASGLNRGATLAQAAEQAMRKGQVAEARRLLEELVILDRRNATHWLNLAATRRATGDFSAALGAVEESLRAQPLHFSALLMRASLLERLGKSREAAAAYGVALAQAPLETVLDPTTRGVVQHGRALNDRYLGDLRVHLESSVLRNAADATPAERQKLDKFIDVTLGLRPRVQQKPTDYFYPGLPPIEFWPREPFPWLAALESQTPVIQQELAAVMAGGRGFDPYVSYPDGVPLDQWETLNHSLDWSAFHFFHQGQNYQENCARCPETMRALSALPQPSVEGRMPAAMFSVLKPKTRIPPHTGVANVRLVMHLPLVVPPGCGFRVGNEIREWKVGEAFVFDDTIEHEAWNDSDQTRVVLIADVWHPYLSANERSLIGRTMIEMDHFNGVKTPLPL